MASKEDDDAVSDGGVDLDGEVDGDYDVDGDDSGMITMTRLVMRILPAVVRMWMLRKT